MFTIDPKGLCDPIRVRPGIDHESVVINQGTDTVIIPVSLVYHVLDALRATVSEVAVHAPKGVSLLRGTLLALDAGGFR